MELVICRFTLGNKQSDDLSCDVTCNLFNVLKVSWVISFFCKIINAQCKKKVTEQSDHLIH